MRCPNLRGSREEMQMQSSTRTYQQHILRNGRNMLSREIRHTQRCHTTGMAPGPPFTTYTQIACYASTSQTTRTQLPSQDLCSISFPLVRTSQRPVLYPNISTRCNPIGIGTCARNTGCP